LVKQRWLILLRIARNWRIIGDSNAHLHLYDKDPRKGRKVAHATVRTETAEQLEALIKKLTTLADKVDDS